MPSAASLATALLGLGLTLVSTFADSLGLSVHQQRVGLVLGVVLMLLGGILYVRARGRTGDPPSTEKVAISGSGRDSYAAARDINVIHVGGSADAGAGQATSELEFDRVYVGSSRPVREENVFHQNWSGVPVVFDVVNPQGGARALAVRPTVVVEDADGNVLAGPTNARWSNPIPPNDEEVERDIAANGAAVGIDTLIQGVDGSGFWLVTDEGLRRGLKANTVRIEVEDVRVTVTLQGENVPTVSKTVRVRRGFPRPALGDGEPENTIVPPPPPDEPGRDPDPPVETTEPKDVVEAPLQPPGRPVDLRGELEVQRDEGYKLLSALKGGAVTIWKYDRVPTAEDVESWTVNVEHLLRDKAKLLYLFKYKPLALQPISNWQDVLRAAVLGQHAAAIADLERLLIQLDKVIEAF